MRIKSLVMTFVLVPFFAFAGDEKSHAHEPADLEQHAKMHENLAKAHADAATCLKEGKDVAICSEAFHKSCDEAGAPGMCGKGHKGMHKGKKHK